MAHIPQETTPVVITPTKDPVSMGSFPEAPFDLYTALSVDFYSADNKTKEMVKEIHTWAMEGSKDMGDALLKISELQRRIGMGGNELDRVYGWVALNSRINDYQKRQKSLERG